MIDNNTNTALLIGQTIKEARTAKGYTQEQLANKLCLTKQAVQRYEKGKTQEIAVGIREKIAAALDIPLYKLLTKEEYELAKHYISYGIKTEKIILLNSANYSPSEWKILSYTVKSVINSIKTARNICPDDFPEPSKEDLKYIESLTPDPEDQPPKEE